MGANKSGRLHGRPLAFYMGAKQNVDNLLTTFGYYNTSFQFCQAFS